MVKLKRKYQQSKNTRQTNTKIISQSSNNNTTSLVEFAKDKELDFV